MLIIEHPCSCGGQEIRFTNGLPSREKQGYRAMCMNCWEDLGFQVREGRKDDNWKGLRGGGR